MAEKRIPIPWSRRLDDFRRRALPLLIWVAAGVVSLRLITEQGLNPDYLGIAEAREHVVAAPMDGRLAELLVRDGQSVEAGELLAAMEAEPLLAALATASAEAARLAAEGLAVRTELEARQAAAALAWESDRRRFTMDAVDLRLELLRLRVELAANEVEAERLRLAEERALALLGTGAGAEADAEDLRLRREEVATRIQTGAVLEAELAAALEEALARAEAADTGGPTAADLEPRLAALAAATRVAELQLAEVELDRAKLLLRAPVAGVVDGLVANDGLTVLAGQELLRLVPRGGTEVVFYQPQMMPAGVAVGDRVLVRRRGGDTEAEAMVVALAPKVTTIPASLWREPAVAEYGRATRLGVLPGLELVPGDPVDVRVAVAETVAP